MDCYLQENLKQYFSATKPLFTQLMALRGECFRQQQGRLTQRITLGNKHYFIKQHTGVGWQEIFKNLFQGRWPVISAKNEWLAIQKLHALGVAAPLVVGFGKSGWNPATMQSFILMEELSPVISLESICENWQQSPATFVLKIALLSQVAQIARIVHQHGINHRDFYLCHFLLDCVGKQQLYLIDLHRAQLRRRTPSRWLIKDLAGLYFSSKEIGLTQRDLYRFMKKYSGKSLRILLNSQRKFWQKVKNRGEQLYREHS